MAVVGLAVALPAEGRPLQILLLGESLTAPEDGGSGYRIDLWRQLIDEGVRFDFVGTRHDRPEHGWWPRYERQPFDPDHQGQAGWRVDHINNGQEGDGDGLENWLDTYTPDVAVVMLGRIDVLQGHETDWTQRELKRAIETLRVDNERVAVLLVSSPALNESERGGMARLDEILMQLAEREHTIRSPVYYVDVFRRFEAERAVDAATGLPNDTGWQLIAKRISSAILLLDDRHLYPARRTSVQTWGAVVVVPTGAALVFFLLARSQVRREKEASFGLTRSEPAGAVSPPRGQRATRIHP